MDYLPQIGMGECRPSRFADPLHRSEIPVSEIIVPSLATSARQPARHSLRTSSRRCRNRCYLDTFRDALSIPRCVITASVFPDGGEEVCNESG